MKKRRELKEITGLTLMAVRKLKKKGGEYGENNRASKLGEIIKPGNGSGGKFKAFDGM